MNISCEKDLQTNLSEWQLRLKLLWRQKSRELWLQAGDRNSKFFHASTLANHRRIFIATIKNDEGAWLDNKEPIGMYLVENFLKPFRDEGVVNCPILDESFHLLVSLVENNSILVMHLEAKIYKVVKSMNPTKAVGPNEMLALFFQRY